MRTENGIGWELNGFELTGTDAEDVWWKVAAVDGWDDPPSTTGQVVQRPMGDGGSLEPAFIEPLTLVLKGRLLAPSRPVGKRAGQAFKDALPLRGLAPLVRSEDGVLSHRLVRLEGKPTLPRDHEIFAPFNIQLVAPDQRLLGGDGSSPYQFQATAFLPSTTGGLPLPLQLPFRIDATVVNGSVTVTVIGKAPPPVLVRINGPAVRPVIRDQDGGVMPLDISLNAGQWLDVDLDARTIKINSTVNRRNLLRGAWITPRSGMVLSLDAAVYNPATSMTVFWTDASY